MHARRVEPAEERLARRLLPLHEVDGRGRGLVVDRLHALLGERAGVLDGLLADLAEARIDRRVVAVGRLAPEHAARPELGEVGRILRIVRQLRLFLGVEVVEVAEELVEAVDRRQRLVAVADVVLAELAGGVAEVLEQAADRRIELAHAHRRAGEADLGQPGADAVLAGEERRAAGGAGLLAVVVQEPDAFAADAVDVRRLVAHQAVRVGADVGDADVVAEDDEDVRLAGRRRRAGAGVGAALCDRGSEAGCGQRRRGHQRGAARAAGRAASNPVPFCIETSRGLSPRCDRSLMIGAPVSDDAPKSDVAGRRVDRLRMARGRAVAAAVVGRAEMRAALDHLSRNFDLGLGGVIARVLGRAARVLRDAARLRGVGGVSLREPVRRPLPDVADHVVQAVAVGRKRGDRRGALEAVGAEVLARKLALPGVGHVRAAGRELVAPGIVDAVEPAARGEFPFRFGRQLLAGPCGVGERVGERDMHDRMVVAAVDVALGAVGMPPVGALQKGPPFAPVAQVDRPRRGREHQRAGVEHVRQCAGIIFRLGRDLRRRDVAGRAHERLELPVGDRRAIDPECIHRDAMNRGLFRIVLVGAHAERAAGDADHAVARVAVLIVGAGRGCRLQHDCAPAVGSFSTRVSVPLV